MGSGSRGRIRSLQPPASDDGFYEVTIRRKPGGLLSDQIWREWQVGTQLITSGPQGFFYHEPLRDTGKIVGLAGGSGITPFRSMAREINKGEMDAELLLLYGSSDQDDILFFDELAELAADGNGKIRAVHVLSCENVALEDCEQGFITAETIAKHADVANSTFFVCGPPAMHSFVENELAKLSVPKKRIRQELYEVADLKIPAAGSSDDAVHGVTVQIGGDTVQVTALRGESLLVALERANVAPPSRCRMGECAFCRAQVVSGEVFISPDNDQRRAADREAGFAHLCVTYPLGDVEIIVPRASP
jgi:ferredoxin-NADP reductase